jgi:energy-coupling factor transport system ATP-binding protein
MEIVVENLSYTYPGGVAALQDVSLRIPPGESLAIVGQNGAGKTTLVKHFNGLLQPGSGRVLVGGWDTRRRSVASLAAVVGYAFQNPDDQLFASTIWGEVIFGPKNLGWPEERVERMAKAALEAVGLSHTSGRHPYDLPVGQRRLITLAALLSMDTPVLILDEPTTGLDHAGSELVGRIVEDLKQQGKTVITVTHDIDFCAEHFARVLVMAGGRLLLDGPASQVLVQDSVLAQSYVNPPQLVRLARRLGMERIPLNAAEFLDAWNSTLPPP